MFGVLSHMPEGIVLRSVGTASRATELRDSLHLAVELSSEGRAPRARSVQ